MNAAGNKNYLNYIFQASIYTFDWLLLCVHWPGSRVQILSGKWIECWLITSVFKGIHLHDMHLRSTSTGLELCFISDSRRCSWHGLPADFIKSNSLHSSYKNSFIIHTQWTVITNGLMRTPFDILDKGTVEAEYMPFFNECLQSACSMYIHACVHAYVYLKNGWKG